MRYILLESINEINTLRRCLTLNTTVRSIITRSSGDGPDRGTWKAPILWRLKDNTLRYGELKRCTAHFRQNAYHPTEAIGGRWIHHPESVCHVPPKTEYSLTEQGRDIIKLITAIRNYGLKMIEKNGTGKWSYIRYFQGMRYTFYQAFEWCFTSYLPNTSTCWSRRQVCVPVICFF